MNEFELEQNIYFQVSISQDMNLEKGYILLKNVYVCSHGNHILVWPLSSENYGKVVVIVDVHIPHVPTIILRS